eukprot:UN27985
MERRDLSEQEIDRLVNAEQESTDNNISDNGDANDDVVVSEAPVQDNIVETENMENVVKETPVTTEKEEEHFPYPDEYRPKADIAKEIEDFPYPEEYRPQTNKEEETTDEDQGEEVEEDDLEAFDDVDDFNADDFDPEDLAEYEEDDYDH